MEDIFAAFTLLIVYISLLSVKAEEFKHLGNSPCSYSTDRRYSGILVDCQGQGLLEVPSSDWIPARTTSLLLQDNSISRLDEDSFPTARQLRFLSLAGNHLTTIDPNAFRQNQQLQSLDLESNRLPLDKDSFTGPRFALLHSLTELRLAHNHNADSWNLLYSPRLLEGLTSLRTLTLDTFSGDLEFNGIFNQTNTLESLSLGGGVGTIKNETFRDFTSIELKELTILNDCHYLTMTETGAFRYLKSLHSFSLYGGSQGLKTTLESLAPFVHRNMTKLYFYKISYRFSKQGAFENESVLSKYFARYLSQICVQHFTLARSNVYIIRVGVLMNPLWFNCIVSLDLSGNPLLGDRTSLFIEPKFKALRVLRVRNRKYSIFSSSDRLPGHYKKSQNTELDFIKRKTYSINDEFVRPGGQNRSLFPLNKRRRMAVIDQVSDDLTSISKGKQSSCVGETFISRTRFHIPFLLPENIVIFSIDGFSENSLHFSSPIKVMGGGHLKEFHASDAGLRIMIESVQGIEGVRILDLSKNDGSQITSCFLSSFPVVSHLNLSRVHLSVALSSSDGTNLFHALSQLENLDLSYNGLYTLPSGIFSQNNLLKVLSLAGNRFKFLPAKGEPLPGLQVLDVSENSLLQLSTNEIARLEQRFHEYSSFSLKLYGNVFSCGCSSIKFLHWMQTTLISLDNYRNYSCIMEDGRITTTSDMKDVAALWRSCNGEKAFLISLVLLSLLILCMSLLVLYMKFQTQIVALVFQYFSKTFTLRNPGDYPTGVYFSYSDQDVDFACGRLREFVEGQLGLSTYIRHRDQVPGSDVAGSTVAAINCCWRILLVISPDYLADQWSFLAMKSAMYAVSSLNPGRLVLVVLSEDVGHRIPAYVLTAVREESIIHVADVADWTLPETQALAHALLH